MVTAQIVLISITPLLFNYALLLVAMALYGGAMGISQPLMIALMARYTGKAHQGKSAGLRTTANQLSAAVMPILIGGIVEIVELEASFYLVGAILVIFMGWVAYAVTRSPAFAANR
jgi:MFS family permease